MSTFINRARTVIDEHAAWMAKDGDDEDERHHFIDVALEFAQDLNGPLVALVLRLEEQRQFVESQFVNSSRGAPRIGWSRYDGQIAQHQESVYEAARAVAKAATGGE